MEFTEVVENRYSCKDYTDKQVEKEKLTKRTGRYRHIHRFKDFV